MFKRCSLKILIATFISISSINAAVTPISVQFDQSCIAKNYMKRMMFEFIPHKNVDIHVESTLGTVLKNNTSLSEVYLESKALNSKAWQPLHILNIDSKNTTNKDIGTIALMIGGNNSGNIASLNLSVNSKGYATLSDRKQRKFSFHNEDCSVSEAKHKNSIKCDCN